MKKWMLFALLSLAFTGCDDAGSDDGGGDGDGDADAIIPDEDPAGTCNYDGLGLCNDYWGDAAADFEMVCSAAGTWSTTEPCDPAGACGTCTVDAGDYIARTYYYDGSGDEASSKSICENGNGIWTDDPSVSCS